MRLTTDELRQDARQAVRTLLKAPAFSAMAVVSLALGIGANTAMFSLVDALLLRSLPVPRPHELVEVRQTGLLGKATKSLGAFAPAVFDAVRSEREMFSDVVGFARLDRPAITIDGSAEPNRQVDRVSSGFFQGLGVVPTRGRTPRSQDGNVALISDRLWQRRFDGVANITERTLTVDDHVYPIIGVLPPAFRGMSIDSATDVWLSTSLAPPLQMIARLRPGVSPSQAQAALQVLFTRLAADRSDLTPSTVKMRMDVSSAGRGFSELRGKYEQALTALSVLVALVLLIACANVGGLVSIRNHARRRELAVRVAIGADRSHLLRYGAIESGILAFVGAALGLMIAQLGVSAILSMVPAAVFPDGLELQVNARLLLFTAAIATVAALLFGLTPVLRASRQAPSDALRSQGPARGNGRFGPIVLAGQVAIAVLLVSAAGLFLRTVRNLGTVDVGFKMDNLLQVSLDTAGAGYKKGQTGALYRQLLEEVRALPGVVSVAGIRNGVLQNGRTHRMMPLRGEPMNADMAWEGSEVSASFFETMGIAVVSGRTFSPADFTSGRPVVVVSESWAKRYLPNENPVGAHIGPTGEVEIIGVVRDARLAGVREESGPMMYDMAPLEPDRFNALEVRTSADAAAIGGIVRDLVRGINPRLLVNVRTMRQEVDRSIARERLVATASGGFGVLGLLLAAVGIYGVASSSVAQRTNELGIRMALGANRWSVVRTSLRESTQALGLGIIAGVAAVVVGARLMSRYEPALLFGVSAGDGLNLALALAVIAGIAALASFVPARRATAIDPLVAIRHE